MAEICEGIRSDKAVSMKKTIWIATYKPNHTFPSASDNYNSLMTYFNPETQFLLKVEVEIPDPDMILTAEPIEPLNKATQ